MQKYLNCYTCNAPFKISQEDFNTKMVLGNSFVIFDCKKCTRKNKSTLLPSKPKEIFTGDPAFLKILNSCKHRGKDFDLDAKYLENLWNKQKFVCVYTNITMILPISGKKKAPHTASLDRIDSAIGYMKGNVQFVCYSINTAKNDFDEIEFIQFVESMKKQSISV
tara:strand:- start:7144 stop:7638 length:495 start_codon:yes stop_codon:yes gene_type:complete